MDIMQTAFTHQVNRMKRAPGARMLQSAGYSTDRFAPGLQPDRFQRSPVSTAAVKSVQVMAAPRFGSCMCPICLSIGVIENAWNEVGKIKAGDTIEVGGLMRQISANTGFDYMVHEDATRLTKPASNEAEENRLKVSFMNRTGASGSTQIVLEVPPEGSIYGVAYSAYLSLKSRPEHYKTYPKAQETLGLVDDMFTAPENVKEPFISTINHQMYPEDEKPNTTAVSMGYLVSKQILSDDKKEYALLGAREMPSFENADIRPAGIMNLMAQMAFGVYGNFDTLAVFSESEDTERYLSHLKKIGVPVKEYVSRDRHLVKPQETLLIPNEYEIQQRQLYPTQAVPVYQVDIRPLKEWIQSGLPDSVRKTILAEDAHIESKMPSADKKGLSDQDLLTILRMPPQKGAKVFDSKNHDHDDEECHLPEELTFAEGESYSLNLDFEDLDEEDTPGS